MNPFHRQLLVTFTRNFAIVLLVLMPVALGIGVARPGEVSSLSGSPSGSLTMTLAALLLAAAPTVLPLVFLISTLVTVGDLARYGEIQALQAAGWSPLRIFLPLISLGLAGSVAIAILTLTGTGDMAPLSGQSSRAALTAMHGARAAILGCLLAVLTAVPLAATMNRRDPFVGFGAALGIHLLHQVATTTAFAFGRHGKLPPVAAGWGGTALLVVVIAFLWRRWNFKPIPRRWVP
jgi:lipopolysaccharide export LptBFGC system permease protein LptF